MPSLLLTILWPVHTLPVYDATPAISNSTDIINSCICGKYDGRMEKLLLRESVR